MLMLDENSNIWNRISVGSHMLYCDSKLVLIPMDLQVGMYSKSKSENLFLVYIKKKTAIFRLQTDKHLHLNNCD